MLDLWQKADIASDSHIKLESSMIFQFDLNVLFLRTNLIRLEDHFAINIAINLGLRRQVLQLLLIVFEVNDLVQ